MSNETLFSDMPEPRAPGDELRELEGVELMRLYFRAVDAIEPVGGRPTEAAIAEFERLAAECRRRGYNLPPRRHEMPIGRSERLTTQALRKLKREYRTLMKRFQVEGTDALKAEVQVVRRRIRDGGGGIVL